MSDFSFSGVLRTIWKNTCALAGSVKRAFDVATYEQPAQLKNGWNYILADENTVRVFAPHHDVFAGPVADGLDYNLEQGTVCTSLQVYLQSTSGYVKEMWHAYDDASDANLTAAQALELKEMGILVGREIVKQATEDGMGVPKDILAMARGFLHNYDPSYKVQPKKPSFTA